MADEKNMKVNEFHLLSRRMWNRLAQHKPSVTVMGFNFFSFFWNNIPLITLELWFILKCVRHPWQSQDNQLYSSGLKIRRFHCWKAGREVEREWFQMCCWNRCFKYVVYQSWALWIQEVMAWWARQWDATQRSVRILLMFLELCLPHGRAQTWKVLLRCSSALMSTSDASNALLSNPTTP